MRPSLGRTIRFAVVTVLLSFILIRIPLDAQGAIAPSPGWIAGSIALPGVNASDVAVMRDSLAVGIGTYGAGSQSIVRIDRDGSTTTLVTGLNSIGGIAFDRAGDRMLFTDNGLSAPPGTAITGDTLYALANPRGVVGPVAASTLELAPKGSIPFAQAILPLAGGDVLVGDAAGFGSGRVVRLSGGTLTDLITGLDYTAGVSLSLTPAGELLVGDVDSTTFAGAIHKFDLTGNALGDLVTGLSGDYDQAVDASGNLLVTGGFTADFSSSSVIAVTPAGAVSEIASGFGFSTGIEIDPPSQQALVLDFGTSHVDTLTPVAALTPGGAGNRECDLEIWGGTFDRTRAGKPRPRWTCADGAPCDRDGSANGSCTFVVGGCFAVADARLARCTPVSISAASVTLSKTLPEGPALQAAIDASLPATAPTCSAGVKISVPAKKTRHVRIRATASGRPIDTDSLTLVCKAGA